MTSSALPLSDIEIIITLGTRLALDRFVFSLLSSFIITVDLGNFVPLFNFSMYV